MVQTAPSEVPGVHAGADANIPIVDLTGSPITPPTLPESEYIPPSPDDLLLLKPEPCQEISTSQPPTEASFVAGSKFSLLPQVPVEQRDKEPAEYITLLNDEKAPVNIRKREHIEAVEHPSKKVKITNPGLRRLRVGNLRHRVTKDDIEYLFRDYHTEAIDLVDDEKGLNALVTLAHPALINVAICQLRKEKVHDQQVTIELDSLFELDRTDPQLQVLGLELNTLLSNPKVSRGFRASFIDPVVLPLHLYHPKPPGAYASSLDDSRDSPDQKAIAENRRLYIYNLPYGTEEQAVRDVLRGFSVENLTIPYDIRVKQPNGYFAFVDFSSFGEMSRALQEVPRTKLNGNEIHAVMRPNKRMLREPRPYVETSHVRLHIKDLAEATTRDDICQLLQDYHITKVSIKHRDNPDRSNLAHVEFTNFEDAYKVATRFTSMTGGKLEFMGCLVKFEVVTCGPPGTGHDNLPSSATAKQPPSSSKEHFIQSALNLKAKSSERAGLRNWWYLEKGLHLDI